ncbi:MAG: hypothetical protein ABI203_07700 [Mucilaginibacter sp.]
MTDNDNNDGSDETEKFPDSDNPDFQPTPKRHGCVTAWIIFMIIANSAATLVYMFNANSLAQKTGVSPITIITLIVIGIFNVIFSVMLLSWKKVGFYGFAISAIAAFIINISIGISPIRSLLGLIGFGILYGILQIKEEGVSAWSYLK